MKTSYLTLAALVMVLLSLGGCGAPSPDESTSVATEALTPVTVFMWMTPGTPVPPVNAASVRLTQDPAHPTPALITVTAFNGGAVPSSYSSTAHTALDTLGAPDWATLRTALNNCIVTGSHLKVTLTYDSSAPGTSKPLTPNPPGVAVFTVCAGVGIGAGC